MYFYVHVPGPSTSITSMYAVHVRTVHVRTCTAYMYVHVRTCTRYLRNQKVQVHFVRASSTFFKKKLKNVLRDCSFCTWCTWRYMYKILKKMRYMYVHVRTCTPKYHPYLDHQPVFIYVESFPDSENSPICVFKKLPKSNHLQERSLIK